jgi:hypothetical protein
MTTYSLYCRHCVEVATAAEGIASPFGGPLGLDGFLESATVMTLPVEHTRVSLCTIPSTV